VTSLKPRTAIGAVIAAALSVLSFASVAAATPPQATVPDSPFEAYGNSVATQVTVRSDAPGRSFTVTTPPSHGAVTSFVPSGNDATAAYTPNAGFAGLDSFVVTVSDGVESSTATAEIAVRPPTVFVSGPGVGAASAVTNNPQPTFSFEAKSGGQRITNATFRCSVDGAPSFACNLGGYPTNPAQSSTNILSDGMHTFQARAATDSGLNADPTPPTVAFVVDTIAPTIAVNSGPSGTVGPNSASFAFTAGSDPNGAVTTQCRLITPSTPSPAFTACTSPASYSGLEEGAHTFEVRATDIAGNSNVAGQSFTVQDNAPVANDQSLETEGTGPIVTTAADADGDQLDYTIDTPPANGGASTASHRVTYTANTTFAGTDSVGYTVADGRGGTDSATLTVTVHPQTAITADPGAGTGAGRPAWSFSSAQADSYECQLATDTAFDAVNGDWEPCTSPYQPADNLDNGTYTFGVRGIANGDPDPTPATQTTVVTNSGSGVADQTFSTEGTAPVNAQLGPATDADDDPLTYELVSSPTLGTLDANTSLPDIVYTPTTGKAGVDTFGVKVSDDRGASNTITVTIEVAPDTVIDSTPDDSTTDNTPTWTFSSPVEDAGFECRVNGGSWVACDDGTFTPDPAVADGGVAFEVRATKGGVADPTPASDSTTVDTTAPDIAFDTVPLDGDTDARPVIAWHSPDSDLDKSEYRSYFDGADPGDFQVATSPVVVDKLTRVGTYHVDVRLTDQLGNSATYTTTWDQANTAPAADAKAVSAEGGAPVAVDVSGSDADPGDTADITFDVVDEPQHGTLTAADADTFTYTPDVDYAGSDSFTYTADDGRENGVSAPATVTLTVTPKTLIDTEPDDFTSDASPTWTFSSPVDAATFACNLDGGGWENCDSGEYTAATDLVDGGHTLEVRATAASLTDPTPASSTITVDTGLPDVSIDANPPAQSNDRTPGFEFSSTDPLTPAPTFECRIDGGAWEACTSGSDIAAQGDGSHTFEVQAVDRAGNRSAIPASYTWEIDATAPVITRGSGPAGATNARRPQWTFSHSDPNGHDAPATAACSVDSGAVTSSCLSPYQPGVNLSDGAHTLHIAVTDSFGNTGTLAVGFTVDTIAPAIAITERPAHPSGPDAAFEFTSGEGDSTYECSLRAANATSGTWEGCTSPKTYAGLASGTRKFLVRSVDPAGNESQAASYIWETVGGAPDTTLTGAKPASGTTETGATFGLHSDDALATFECSLDGSAFAACASPKAYTGLAVGSHTFKVRAVNEIGTADATPAEHTWSIADPPPPPAGQDTPPADNRDTTAPVIPPTTPIGQTPQTPQKPSCSGMAAKTLTAPKFTVATGVAFKVRLDHRSARVGQVVKVSLVLGGKLTPKALSKSIASIALLDGSKTVATLKGSKWTATFKPATAGARKLTIKVTPKKGAKKTAGTLNLAVEAAC
jgi:hypothetical protein